MKNEGTLTSKQEAVYRFIKGRISATGRAPTIREIAEKLGKISIGTAAQHVKALQRKGFIVRSRYARRGIDLPEQEMVEEQIKVPVLASAGCGNPSITAQENYDEYVMLSPDVVDGNSRNLFIFRAIGSSMQDSGISDGDLVLVQKTEDVQTGDRAVVIVDGDAVIKQIMFADDAVVLSPASKDPQYHKIILKRDNFNIFGKVVRVIKLNAEQQYVPLSEQDQ